MEAKIKPSASISLAERVGFEPTVGYKPTPIFKTGAINQLDHLSILVAVLNNKYILAYFFIYCQQIFNKILNIFIFLCIFKKNLEKITHFFYYFYFFGSRKPFKIKSFKFLLNFLLKIFYYFRLFFY